MNFYNKKIEVLVIELGDLIIPYSYLNIILEYNENDVFSFFYFENYLSEYLLKENIIELHSVSGNEDEKFYTFKDYTKLVHLRKKVNEHLDNNLMILERDFKIKSLNI